MNRLGWRKDNDDSDPPDDNPRSPSASRDVPARRTYNPDDAMDRVSGARSGRDYDSGAERDKGGRPGPLASPFGGRGSDRPSTGDRSADRGRDADKDKGGSRFSNLLGRGKDDKPAQGRPADRSADRSADRGRDADKDKGGSRFSNLLGRGKDDKPAQDRPARPTGSYGQPGQPGRPGSAGSPSKGKPEQDKGGGGLGGFFRRGGEDKDKTKSKGKEADRSPSGPFVGSTASRSDPSRPGYQRPGTPGASPTADSTGRPTDRYGAGSTYNRPVGGTSPYGTGPNRYGTSGTGDEDDENDEDRPNRSADRYGAGGTYGRPAGTSPYGTTPSRYGTSGTGDEDDEDAEDRPNRSADRYGAGSTYNRPTGSMTTTGGSSPRPYGESSPYGTPRTSSKGAPGGPFGVRDTTAKPDAAPQGEEKRKSRLGGLLPGRKSQGTEQDKDKDKDKSAQASSSIARPMGGAANRPGSRPAGGTSPGGIGGTPARSGRDVAPTAQPDRRSGVSAPQDSRAGARTEAKPAAKPAEIDRQRSKGAPSPAKAGAAPAATSKAARPVAKPLAGTKAKGALTMHQGLDFNRKLDLVGVALVIFSVIGFFAVAPSMTMGLLPSSQGGVTGSLNTLLSQLFGWGKILIPLGAGAVGIWLMVRTFDEGSLELDYMRIIGILLLFACVLTWLQFGQLVDDVAPSIEAFRPVSYALAVESGEGGGWFGHQFYLFLLTQLGDYGAVGVLVPWLIVALMLTFNLSLVELVGYFTAIFGFIKFTSREERIKRRRARLAMKSGTVPVGRPGEAPPVGAPAMHSAATPISVPSAAVSQTVTSPAAVPQLAAPGIETAPADTAGTGASLPRRGGRSLAEPLTGASTEPVPPDPTRPPVRPGLAVAPAETGSPAGTSTVPAGSAAGPIAAALTEEERQKSRRRLPHLPRRAPAEPQTAAKSGDSSTSEDVDGGKRRWPFGRKAAEPAPAAPASAQPEPSVEPAPVGSPALPLAAGASAAQASTAEEGKRGGLGRLFGRGTTAPAEPAQSAAAESQTPAPSETARRDRLASPFDSAPARASEPAADAAAPDAPASGRRWSPFGGPRTDERSAPDRAPIGRRDTSGDGDREAASTLKPSADRALDRDRFTPRERPPDREPSEGERRGPGALIAGAAAGAAVGAALRALSDDEDTPAPQRVSRVPSPTESERPFARRPEVQAGPPGPARSAPLRSPFGTPPPADDTQPADREDDVPADEADLPGGWQDSSAPNFAERARRRALGLGTENRIALDRKGDDNDLDEDDMDDDDDLAAADDHDDEDDDGGGFVRRPPAPGRSPWSASRSGPASGPMRPTAPRAAESTGPRSGAPTPDEASRTEPAARSDSTAPRPAGTAAVLPGRSLPGQTPPARTLPGAGNLTAPGRPAPDAASPSGERVPGAPSPARADEPNPLAARSAPGDSPSAAPGPDASTPPRPAAPLARAADAPAHLDDKTPAGERKPETDTSPQDETPSSDEPSAAADRPARPVGIAAALPGRVLPGRTLPGRTPPDTASPAAPTPAAPTSAAPVPGTPTPARPASPAPSAGATTPGTPTPGTTTATTPTAGTPGASPPAPYSPNPPAPHGNPIVRHHTAAVPAGDETTKAAPVTGGTSGLTPTRRAPVPRVAEDEPDDDEPMTSRAPAARTRNGWELPDYRRLLRPGDEQRVNDEVLLEKARVIEDTLNSFGAPGKVVEVNPGPVITQFGVEPDYLVQRSGKKTRVKVNQIARLDADLALALAAKTIRIEAPVPGKGYVGIEVPNDEVANVGLRDVMDSHEFRRIDSKLRIALGLGVDGTPVAADLTAMPHLLIAGTTGSGKSVCVNAIISCLLLANKPDEVQFIMVDPKRVELTGYNGVPHLVAPVVVDLERIVGVLQWVQREMEERYRKFAASSSRNILDYNTKLEPGMPRMPYYVVVVDELADLMMLAPDETERLLARLAQMARATGIHLIISTQRPSVDVVTGLIKANFPARIAFAVASSVDSRVILDQPGAEKLLGRGDMLFQSPDAAAPLRMQGVFVSDEEINAITRYWKTQSPTGGDAASGPSPLVAPASPGRMESIALDTAGERDHRKSKPSRPPQPTLWAESELDDSAGGTDDMYQEAVELVQRLNKASISLLQRRLRIGYTRAARLIDLMEQDGIIGPAQEGSKPREVISHSPVSGGSGDD